MLKKKNVLRDVNVLAILNSPVCAGHENNLVINITTGSVFFLKIQLKSGIKVIKENPT